MTCDLDKEKIGISALRIICCVLVITTHFYKEQGVIRSIIPYAAPVFMILAFYFSAPIFIEYNLDKLKKRIIRIYFPFVFWSISSWFVIFLGFRITKQNMEYGIRDLLWQLTLGSGYHVNSPLWFMVVLIILTVYHFINFRWLVKTEYICIVITAAFLIQYTQINWRLFSSMRFEIKYTLGRFIEMLPLSLLGILIYTYMDILRRHYRLIILLSAFIGALFGVIKPYIEPAAHFGYAGLEISLVSTCLVLAFGFIPTQKWPQMIKKVVSFMASFSLGIYCMHYPIGVIVDFILLQLGFRINCTIQEVVLIYFVCLLLSYLISKIPIKGISMLVS